jgi:isopentenyl-diphosphate delta-isomerase type 1
MQTELLIVVDEHDHPVGTASRSDVHRKGLFHRAVHVLVVNNASQVFLQLRSTSKDRYPNRWDSSASGHVEAGETYEAAAIRELSEELGILSPVKLEPLIKLPGSIETDNEFVQVFKCCWDGPISINPKEIEDGRWFSPQEIDEWVKSKSTLFAPSFVAIWSHFKRERSSLMLI